MCADLIKIDIQGAELMALQNGTETVREALVIESEVEFVPLYEGQALFCDLQAFLREQGFVFHKFLDMAGRAFRPFLPPNPHAPLSQLLWADAIFVRDFTELDRWTDTDLLKAQQYSMVCIIPTISLHFCSGNTTAENGQESTCCIWRHSDWLRAAHDVHHQSLRVVLEECSTALRVISKVR